MEILSIHAYNLYYVIAKTERVGCFSNSQVDSVKKISTLCEHFTSWISLTEHIIYKSSDFAFHQTPTRGALLKFISKMTIQWDPYNV